VFCFISDVHSQYDRLQRAVDYALSKELKIILLGDIFDSRVVYSDTVSVFNLVHSLINKGHYCVNSNHQDKLIRYLKGNNVKQNNGLEKTIREFEDLNVDKESIFRLLTSFPYGIAIKNSNNKEFRIAHAYFPSRVNPEGKFVYRNDINRRYRDVFIYGKSDRDQNRIAWWTTPNPDQQFVRVAGHYHQVYIDDKSIVLDSECGSGGCLSLYIPDKDIIKEF
jgi:protein phosphatase